MWYKQSAQELLAKYSSSWGDTPYMVKKGGEKVFRHFIEKISPEDNSLAVEIDRDFYEDLIAKIILFRRLEKIYGQGMNSMGQLRAAVIPYSLSVAYINTDGSNQGIKFNFSKIWKKGDIEDDLAEYFKKLMLLMNNLIKNYSSSDDFGEYSKNPELWNRIKSCEEIRHFLAEKDNEESIKNYTVECLDKTSKIVLTGFPIVM